MVVHQAKGFIRNQPFYCIFEITSGASGQRGYWQLLLWAFAIARNVMPTCGKVTRPAHVGSPVSCGTSPLLSS
jgi:hypothetical protein